MMRISPGIRRLTLCSALSYSALPACNRNAAPEPTAHASQELKLVGASATPSSALSALAPPGGVPVTNLDPRALLPSGSSAAHFAVLGDFGESGSGEAAVASLIKSWQPEFIVTTGDNNYPEGAAETIDANIGQYFHEFIFPYKGKYGPGASENRFFPSLGNHDWMAPRAKPYFDYFELPGNERYYDFVRGAVHFFAIDSDINEPEGITASSKQALWLKQQLAKSKARWQVVYMHHPPYSSGSHGSTLETQWPFKEWGVDLVLAGHDHIYERLSVGGLPYIVIGLGGRQIYPFINDATGSQTRYNDTLGALRVAANDQALICYFINIDGKRIDQLELR
jgi:hypothetical protein